MACAPARLDGVDDKGHHEPHRLREEDELAVVGLPFEVQVNILARHGRRKTETRQLRQVGAILLQRASKATRRSLLLIKALGRSDFAAKAPRGHDDGEHASGGMQRRSNQMEERVQSRNLKGDEGEQACSSEQ